MPCGPRAVPAFVLNHGVWLQDRLLAVTDGWLPDTGVGWEVDSRRHHGGSDDLDATLRRHDVFERHRLVLLHVTPRRFRADPTSFVRELVSRVAERLVLSAPEPPGLVVLPPGVRPFAA